MLFINSLYPPTPALAKAGAAPGTTEGVEPELSKSLLFWARKQKRQKFALARLWALGSVPDCGPYWPQTPQTPQAPQTLRHLPMVVPYVWILNASDAPWMLQTLQNLALARLWSLGSARIRRSKTSHLPDCGLWALRDCGRSCAGCGLVWALRDCGRSCAGCGLGALARRSSQPLDSGRFRRAKTSHLPDCGLWALRDCGRSCAGCGLGALARQILFF